MRPGSADRRAAGSLKPAPLAIIAAASENQQYDDYDQNCPRVHDNLLWTREPGVTARRRVARVEGAPRGAAAPSVPMGIPSVTLPAFTLPLQNEARAILFLARFLTALGAGEGFERGVAVMRRLLRALRLRVIVGGR